MFSLSKLRSAVFTHDTPPSGETFTFPFLSPSIDIPSTACFTSRGILVWLEVDAEVPAVFSLMLKCCQYNSTINAIKLFSKETLLRLKFH